MQRCIGVAVTAFFIAGCASGPGAHPMSVDVIELVSSYQRSADAGSHFYVIQIRNRSEQTVMIHTITVQAGTSDYEIDDVPQQVESPLAPGESQQFQVMATVQRSRAASGAFAMEELRLTISCTDESGKDFFESGSYPIRHQASN